MAGPAPLPLLLSYDLPACRFRRKDESLPQDRYRCDSPLLFTPLGSVSRETCLKCPCPDRELVGIKKPDEPPRRDVIHAPCQFLGDKIREDECQSCAGRVRLKVFRCWHPNHTETTYGFCQACPDYQAKPCAACKE